MTAVNHSLASDISTAIAEAMNRQTQHEAATAPMAEAVREAIMSLKIRDAIAHATRSHADDVELSVGTSQNSQDQRRT
ncbi:hypothetical protein SEPCBS119000_000297 [Sporothrix epigloea]|uniref:Uncharacterized protein n=1 Tax=Sporothrix epigloea TaxID=1892477 RepID=A0ABP0D4C0_9PEZI